ncbi:hypothetical protein AAGG14_05155 [Enterococcus faecium]
MFFAKKRRFHIRQVLHLPFFCVKMVVCKRRLFYGKNCHYRWRDHWYDPSQLLRYIKIQCCFI